MAFTLTTLLSSVVHAAQNPAEQTPPEPALITGPVTITVSDYHQALLALKPEQRRTVENNPIRKRELLFELYTEKMLERKARQLGLDQQNDLQAKLARATRAILVDAIVGQQNEQLQEPDFTELAEEYYLTHQQDYAQPERIRVAHILWSVQCDCEDEDGAKWTQAKTVLKELRDGGDFTELARQHSDDKASANNGGDLGQWITRGMLVKPLDDIAFTLEVGAISDVIKTEYGYHIIKLIAHEPAGIQPFEQVKDNIIKKLSRQFESSAHKAFVAEYYPKSEQFNNTAIDALPLINDSSD